jgi:hypothetical protein
LALKTSDVNWFRPLWRRVGVTAFLAIWCAWEWLWNKEPFWGVLVGAALAYSLYNFFYAFPKEEPANEQIPPPSAPEDDDGPRP